MSARPMFVVTLVTCSLATCFAGCGEETPQTEPSADPSPTTAPPEPAQPAADPSAQAIDARDQYTMLAAIEASESADEDVIEQRMAEVVEGWQGRRFRWEMMRVEALCTRAEACLFAPFDLSRFDHPIHASWLPAVRMSADEMSALSTQCQPFGAECVVTLEATLEELALSSDAPTHVTLTNAHVASVRARRDEELFLSRAPARFDGPRPLHPLGAVPLPAVVVERSE